MTYSPLVSEIQAATTNAGARAEGGLTPDFLALSAPSKRFGEFRLENRSIGCRWESKRLTVEVDWSDQER